MRIRIVFGACLFLALMLLGCADIGRRVEQAFDRAWVNYEKDEDARPPPNYHAPQYSIPYSRGCIKIEQYSMDPRPGGRINIVPDTAIICNR